MSGPEVEETVAYLGSKKRRGKLPQGKERIQHINEGACSYLCVDKIKSRPSGGYRIGRARARRKSRAEQLSQNLVRPEDLG